MNPDCPVCSAEGADLTACLGKVPVLRTAAVIPAAITVGIDAPNLSNSQPQTATLPKGMTVVGVEWTPQADYRFEYEQEYTVIITYALEEGYELPENPTVTLPERAKSAVIDTNRQTITVVYEPIVVTAVEVCIVSGGSTTIPVPKAGPNETVTDGRTFQVMTSYSDGNEDLTTGRGDQYWEVTLPEGVTWEPEKIIVSNTSQPGAGAVTYTVGQATHTLEFTVTKEESAATHIVISGATEQVTVPLEGQTNLVTQPFACQVYDQYGQFDDMGQDQVAWRVETDFPSTLKPVPSPSPPRRKPGSSPSGRSPRRPAAQWRWQ